MTTSTQDAVREAFEKLEAQGNETQAAEPVAVADVGGGAAGPAPAVGDDYNGDVGRPVPEQPGAPAPTRDASGRFAKAETKPTETPKPKEATPSVTPPPTIPADSQNGTPPPAPGSPSLALKPPASWKPGAREKWASLPPEVQQEIDKREKDATASLSQARDNKAFRDQWKELTSPFESHIRANGGEVLATVQNLLRTQHQLAMGHPQQRAQIVADIIRTYGVDGDALVAALQGQGAPQQPQGQEYRDPRFDQFLQGLQSEKQRRDEARRSQMAQELERFKEANEFYEDVKHEMAAMLDAGVARDLAEAYARASWANPEVRAILQQREAAKQANAISASTQRAKAAASSVKSQPAASMNGAQPKSTREAVEHAWEMLSRK